jgi:integrase
MQPKFRVVEQEDGRFLVDVRGALPSGRVFRRRVIPKVSSKKQAQDYGYALWKAALDGVLEVRRAKPKLSKIWPVFWEQHVLGSRLKPSQQRSLESLWDNHIGKVFGDMPVTDIDYAAIQAFKGSRADKAPKTVNNALIALKTVLKFAQDKGHLVTLPKIQMLKVQKGRPTIYDIPTYSRLVETALTMSLEHAAVVLLGGECGLRAGEMQALDHGDVHGNSLVIQRSAWRKHVGPTKGYAARTVPMTPRTAAVIHELAKRKGLIVRQRQGQASSHNSLTKLLRQAQAEARVPKLSLHALRHTFATDVTKLLGIRAAQKLLGHADVTTTERYEHGVADNETALVLERGRLPAKVTK